MCVCVLWWRWCTGESTFVLQQVRSLFVFASMCVSVSICVCVTAKEYQRVRFSVSKVTAAYFLRVDGGNSDHRRPTLDKFIFSCKKNEHFRGIPSRSAHCLLVITNGKKRRNTEGRRGFSCMHMFLIIFAFIVCTRNLSFIVGNVIP